MTRRPEADRSFWSMVAWWERRRIGYNLFLVAVGIPALVVFFLAIEASHSLRPGEDAVEPLAIIAAPFLANLAYTAGWFVEWLLLSHGLRGPFGPSLMKAGHLFSLAVVLAPALMWTVIALI